MLRKVNICDERQVRQVGEKTNIVSEQTLGGCDDDLQVYVSDSLSRANPS